MSFKVLNKFLITPTCLIMMTEGLDMPAFEEQQFGPKKKISIKPVNWEGVGVIFQ